jgi:hypothetical protein
MGGEWRAEVGAVIRSVVAAEPGIAWSAAMAKVREQVGWADEDDEEAEKAVDDLVMTHRLEVLAPDRLVDPAALAQGIVLTHRIDKFDATMDRVPTGSDLCGLAASEGPFRTEAGGVLDDEHGTLGHRWWYGPEGWLEAYQEGTLIAVRVDDEGVVRIEVLDDEPTPDPELAAALRAVYDREVAEPDLPVSFSTCCAVCWSRTRAGSSRRRLLSWRWRRRPACSSWAAGPHTTRTCGTTNGRCSACTPCSIWSTTRRIDGGCSTSSRCSMARSSRRRPSQDPPSGSGSWRC